VTAVSRWDVTDMLNSAKKLSTYTNYYNTGTPISVVPGHKPPPGSRIVGEFAFEPEYGFSGNLFPESDRENSYRDSNSDCSIEVNFGGNISRGTPRFDTGPNHVKLGESSETLNLGKDRWIDYAFRFEVRGSVKQGRIGHIGTERDLHNGGQWTIGQWAYAWPDNQRNGVLGEKNGTTFNDSPKYLKGDKLGPPTVAINGRSFAWIDGPGFLSSPDSPVTSAKFTTNFIVYAQNGGKRCAVEFHIQASFSDGTWRATIGRGLLH